MATGNIAVAERDLPFLKYRVDEVIRPEEAGGLTVEKTLDALGLDFDVELRSVFVQQKGEKRGRIKVPNAAATVRTDTEEVLGLVGDRYHVVQNREALSLGNVLLDSSEALIESGWSLRGGRMTGVTLRIPSADVRVPGDGDGLLQMHLLLSNSHDGNSSLGGWLGPVRLGCTNMIRLFKKAAVSHFRIKHTSGVAGKIAAMRDALGITFTYSKALEEMADQLMHTTLVESQVDAILKAAFPIKADASDAQRENAVQSALMQNWLTSPTIEEVRGTGWGVVNAVNEYFEHLQPVRTRSFDADSVRGISILQGTAYMATNRVAEAVLKAV